MATEDNPNGIIRDIFTPSEQVYIIIIYYIDVPSDVILRGRRFQQQNNTLQTYQLRIKHYKLYSYITVWYRHVLLI